MNLEILLMPFIQHSLMPGHCQFSLNLMTFILEPKVGKR